MGQSYRIRTELGINKTINVQLDQEFDFLELLSLKLQQEDIYTRSCADYGVLVGRVTANNGFGIPNARLSIFIPIETVDQSNPIITSIYPYKSPSDKNEDGYRYNLLPYEKSYSKHAATGTLPTRLDVLTGQTAIEIFDKYYKYTAKTNESGDYMIMGVPLGNQTIVMDVDLSDIGEFSLTPQDLIRMGVATEAQVSGNQFRTSNDLNSLPQLITINKTADISPLWGEPNICQIAINRVDFDLRDDANIDIQPTSVFMGSIYSAPDKFRVRNNCKPRDNMGNLCDLDTGPGQILAIRQTISQDSNGNPVLEQYQLEQAGNIIDGNGVWITEVPMNLDYVVTNEFGEKVISNDPTIGIPTKGKYRFKIKWQQSPTLTEQTRRAYFLVPNVREYGWTNSQQDPNYGGVTVAQQNQLKSSYYFGLDWTGYTNGLQGTEINEKLDEMIDCQDTFYEFNFNKVYTVAGLIDQYKNGARGRFIGIKEIDDDSCTSTVNKFPTNDGFRNFDFLFFIFSLLFQVVQVIGLPLLIIAHIALAVYSLLIGLLCLLCGIKIPVINVRPFAFICNVLGIKCQKQNFTIRLPMITYPNCEACQCKETTIMNELVGNGASGVLSYVSYSSSYYDGIQNVITPFVESEDVQPLALIYSQTTAGNGDNVADLGLFKMPKSSVTRLASDDNRHFSWGTTIPLGERINLFNGRINYFNNKNKIKVTFSRSTNNPTTKFHYDNTTTVLANTFFESGTLLTAVDPGTSSDLNFLYTATTDNGVVYGITGNTQLTPFNLTVNYASTQTTNTSQTYSLPYGASVQRQLYPMDREYFQVVTAITISEAVKLWNTPKSQTLPDILTSEMGIILYRHRDTFNYKFQSEIYLKFSDTFQDWGNQYILILQRGVDPYSPKYENEYGIGKLFGLSSESSLTITASTRVNIPIQKLNSPAKSVQNFTYSDMFYESSFFTPGNEFSGFTSPTIGYYGAMDSSYPKISPNIYPNKSLNGVIGVVSSLGNDLFFAENNTVLNQRIDTGRYGASEDISGGSYIYLTRPAKTYNKVRYSYYTPNFYPTYSGGTFQLSSKNQTVMRTDRLPSSDVLNGYSWNTNPALLQQNNNFQFYPIVDLDADSTNPGYSVGASQVQPDLEDQPLSTNVFDSFECINMVGLKCYSGNGYNFGVNVTCRQTDAVERGCYVLLKRPLRDLIKDLETYNEWGYRFRFFYGLCRGVLSQSFMNNWVNGSLFAFPIQTNTFYDSKNQPYSTFCKDIIYFDKDTTNFYYRSSPYSYQQNKFIGKFRRNTTAVNTLNLLFPTTILNLGPKDSFYQEITFDPSNKGYVLDQLNPTSFGDTSDIINLFVISRIVNQGFLQRLFSLGDNSLDALFSRGDNPGLFRDSKRIDGDLAQMISINSEVGVINFSPEFYRTTGSTIGPIYVGGTSNKPVIGIWYSSTTENLQLKDYLTPGRIDFRGPNTQLYPYNYGIKSQVVPFYQWGLQNTTTIFGGEMNDWKTTSTDIVQGKEYQSLDRLNITTPSYFVGSNTAISDTFARGYIFDVNGTSATEYTYSLKSGIVPNKFIVGAPFHFYFGLIKGESALDKFKTKYSVGE